MQKPQQNQVKSTKIAISDIRKILDSRFLYGTDLLVDKIEELDNRIKQIEENTTVYLDNP